MEHPDFANNANPPSSLTDDQVKPTFKIVKRGERRIVLILDKSGSMKGDKINLLQQV